MNNYIKNKEVRAFRGYIAPPPPPPPYEAQKIKVAFHQILISF